MKDGWVKLHRKILKSDLWKLDAKTKVLALTLIMLANSDYGIASIDGNEIVLEPGQKLTSLKHLAEWCGDDFTPSTVRNSLKKLENVGFLTVDANRRYTIIEVLSYEKYQFVKTNPPRNPEPDSKDYVKEIVRYLNLKTGKKYRYTTKSYARHITARIKEGYSVEDFYKVIDHKVKEWIGTNMEAYLTPNTLFSPSHFEDYLNAAPNADYAEDSDQYRLVQYFEGFVQRIDEKYRVFDRQSAAVAFDRLLNRRHSANEIYYTMRTMFEVNNPWMIKKYKDPIKFCRDFESIYIDLKIDFKGRQ